MSGMPGYFSGVFDYNSNVVYSRLSLEKRPPELEFSGRKVGLNSKTLFNLKIENSIWLTCASTSGKTCELHLLLATLSVFFVIKQLTDSEF